METLDALERAYAMCAAALDRVNEANRDDPTACEDWTLGMLAGHVVGTASAFAQVLADGPTPARARVVGNEATSARLRADAAAGIAGWKRDGALAREYDRVIELDEGVLIPPIPLPGEMLLAINLLDIGVHAHDLARAVGAPQLADDDGVAYATLSAAELILQPGIRELAGFGPERPPSSDPSPSERLLAFVGR